MAEIECLTRRTKERDGTTTVISESSPMASKAQSYTSTDSHMIERDENALSQWIELISPAPESMRYILRKAKYTQEDQAQTATEQTFEKASDAQEKTAYHI